MTDSPKAKQRTSVRFRLGKHDSDIADYLDHLPANQITPTLKKLIRQQLTPANTDLPQPTLSDLNHKLNAILEKLNRLS